VSLVREAPDAGDGLARLAESFRAVARESGGESIGVAVVAEVPGVGAGQGVSRVDGTMPIDQAAPLQGYLSTFPERSGPLYFGQTDSAETAAADALAAVRAQFEAWWDRSIHRVVLTRVPVPAAAPAPRQEARTESGRGPGPQDAPVHRSRAAEVPLPAGTPVTGEGVRVETLGEDHFRIGGRDFQIHRGADTLSQAVDRLNALDAGVRATHDPMVQTLTLAVAVDGSHAAMAMPLPPSVTEAPRTSQKVEPARGSAQSRPRPSERDGVGDGDSPLRRGFRLDRFV
jgi:hypothetical protein